MSITNVSLVAANAVVAVPPNWPGGRGVLVGSGTFSTTTVTLQFKLPDGSFASTTITLAAPGVSAVFELPQGVIQAALSGGGSPANLVVNAQVIPTNLN